MHMASTRTELAKQMCSQVKPCRFGDNAVCLAHDTTGHFPLNTDKILTGQTCVLSDKTQQLSWNGCAEV